MESSAGRRLSLDQRIFLVLFGVLVFTSYSRDTSEFHFVRIIHTICMVCVLCYLRAVKFLYLSFIDLNSIFFYYYYYK